MSAELRVGVIDSGCALHQATWVQEARSFRLKDETLVEDMAVPDTLGHGSAVMSALVEGAPLARFYLGQVFVERLQTSPAQIAAALCWLIDQNVMLINCSLGLRSDRLILRQACEVALESGVMLCASSPAQGGAVFPASYPGVVRITGDARCGVGQWSWLNSAQADFGASAAASNGIVGASIACARLSGTIAGYLQREPGADHRAVLAWLRGSSSFLGPEQRRGGSG